uniref:Spliceosome-associated factor, putative n=1 Tax=Theileria annulata TaxID=5874 RepID=A0A3B0MSH2_THEAN
MKFILELIRSDHEELEHLEKVVSILLNDRKKATGPKLVTIELAIDSLVKESQNIAKQCIEFYKDADGLRKKEIKYLAGQDEDDKDESKVWSNYYATIKNVKDFYKQNSRYNKTVENRNVQETVKRTLNGINLDSIFSPDENYGLCLNLQDHYHTFINLQPLRNFRINTHRQKEVLRLRNLGLTDENMLESHMTPFSEMDYVAYINSFDQFHLIPRYCKYRNAPYVGYLTALSEYLEDFFKRQNPLSNHELLKKQMEESFESAWNGGNLQYWRDPTELLPLYLAPVDKLFGSEGLLNSFKNGKKYKSIMEMYSGKSSDELELLSFESRNHDKMIAFKEFIIQSYRDVLASTIQKTVEFVQKRESRTVKELENSQTLAQEILDALETNVVESDSEVEEDEKPVYNPLNLPLGWDGKPIPFWLYKLHGLGQEFKCEICGGSSYWGRKAFENHFQEFRHSFGMKVLGIPNTPHFKEITNIQEALDLYKKLNNEAAEKTFKIFSEAECEDNEGESGTEYEWEQSFDDLILYVKVDPKTNKNDISVQFNTNSINIQILNFQYTNTEINNINKEINNISVKKCVKENYEENVKKLYGELYSVIVVNESFWILGDSELEVHLSKAKPGEVWQSLIKGDEALSDFAHRDEKKRLLLERFQKEHPRFDFSDAQLNGNVPEPRTFMR